MKWLRIFRVGKQVLNVIDELGITVKGRHPAEVEGAIEQIVKDGIGKGKLALAKPPKPGTTP
jgi:hypothetical protein